MGRAERQKRLEGHTMTEMMVRINTECFLKCKMTLGCVSVNACKGANGGVLCELNDAVASEKETNESCTHYELDVDNCN